MELKLEPRTLVSEPELRPSQAHPCQITRGEIKAKEGNSEKGAGAGVGGVSVAEGQPLKP